jgi:uncharacterized membrane protein YbhN (UPF0104 family)
VNRGRFIAWGRWVVGVVALTIVAASLDLGRTLQDLATANLGLAIVGVGGLVGVHLVGAATWRVLCLQLGGVRIGWRAAIGRYYAAQALGGITPANIGGDVYRIYALREAGFDGAVAPVIVQRATSYLGLGLLGLVALWVLSSSVPVASGVVIAAVVVALLTAASAMILLLPWRRLDAIRNALLRLFGGPPMKHPIGERRASYASLGAVGIGLVLGVAFHAAAIVCTFILVLSVLPSAPVAPTLAALAIARLSVSVPISPSGLGIQEAALVVLFAGIGLSAEVALAAMLLGRVALLATTALGSASLLIGRRQVRLEATGSTA